MKLATGELKKGGDKMKNNVGIAFKNVDVYGFDDPTAHQRTFLNYPLAIVTQLVRKYCQRPEDSRLCILRNFEGVVSGGEMLLVLGRPGSGCTTLLKTLARDTYGLHVDPKAFISYQGISAALKNPDRAYN